jgi:hypothetical protein
LSPDIRTAAIEHLKSCGILPVYVYFDIANVASQTANKVAASFLKQLSYPPDQDRPFLRIIYENIKPENDRPSREAIINLFVQCSRSVNVRVLFDGLDECNENELGKIYELIQKLRGANIGVFLTTRPHISGDLLGTQFRDASYIVDLQADQEDVRNVLEHRIREHRQPIGPELKEDILSRILNSRGTYVLPLKGAYQFRFLLASLQLEHVLRAKGNRNIRNALETVPSTTDKAFEGILKRIELQEDGTANTAYRALTWCYHALYPLDIDELCDYLALQDEQHESNTDRDSPSSVVDCCMSFITYNPQHRHPQVSFIHPSVHRWFEREPQHQKLLSHAYLAETCLTYLMQFSSAHAYSRYAGVHWNYHTVNAQHEPAVQKAAFTFLQNQFLVRKLRQFQLHALQGESILHIMVLADLDELCKILLNEDVV